uniref:Tetratricopeptide repeat protein 29 n=1 Tax=Trichobilharzia regenti TaxID=157069 RepID=A0AA85KJT2_TRIRE|nr:unnamed protein product [Trichobilharzia regenti]
MSADPTSNRSSRNASAKQSSAKIPKKLHQLEPMTIKQKFNNSVSNIKFKSCELPKLSKYDVNWFRLQLHENLLINLLQNGYHQTFSEIFYLIDFEEKRRLQHGISSPYWYATQLTERRDILAELMTHLINAENAYRLNHIEEVYKENLYLAGLFRSSVKDDWLLEYFLQKSMKIVNQAYITVKNMLRTQKTPDGSIKKNLCDMKIVLKKRLLEAVFHNATYLYETEKYQQALELYKHLSRKLQKHTELLKPSINPFEDEESVTMMTTPQKTTTPVIPLNILCCEQICKSLLAIYKPKPRISSEDNDDNDDDDQPSKLLSYLNEALDYAEKSENQKLMGLCNKQISQVYQVNEQYETAYEFAEKYLHAAEQTDDVLEKIEAYKLLANINESLLKIDEAESNYSSIVSCASQWNNPTILLEAYEMLTKFYITKTHKYELAKLTSENGLKYAQTMEDNPAIAATTNLQKSLITDLIHQLKLYYSIAKGKLLEVDYLTTMIAAQTNSQDMLSLIKWKNKHDDLSAYDKDYFMKVTYDSFSQKRKDIVQLVTTKASN